MGNRKMTCFQHKINVMNSINNKHFNHIMNESTNCSTSELRMTVINTLLAWIMIFTIYF